MNRSYLLVAITLLFLTACGATTASSVGSNGADPESLLTPAPPQNNPDNIVPFPSFPSFPYPAYSYLVGVDPSPRYLLGVFNLEQQQCILTDPTGLPLPDQHAVQSATLASLTTAWTPADILVHCETGPENATLLLEHGVVTVVDPAGSVTLSFDVESHRVLATPDAATQDRIYNKQIVLLRAVYEVDGSAPVDRLLVYDSQIEGFYIPGDFGSAGLAALHVETVQFVIPTHFDSLNLQTAQAIGDL